MLQTTRPVRVPIETIDVSVYTVPTDFPESDGTYAWDKTTLVLVEATAGGKHGLGYSYADTATAPLVEELLADVVRGRDAFDVPGAWAEMVHAIRNLGRRMLEAEAVDVLQADATRCAGITGFLQLGALCQARSYGGRASSVRC